jgi:alpha-L-arabinofuranosidase
VAAESQDRAKLILFCVNRHLTRGIPARFDLTALPAAAGPAKVTTIRGENILTENDEEDPRRVVPVTRSLQIQADGYTFPNASVTVIEVPLKK